MEPTSQNSRAPLLIALSLLLVIVASGIGYLKLRPGRSPSRDAGQVSGDPNEVGDQRYTLVCDACSATFELSAGEFDRAFHAAANGAGLVCTRCHAPRAHLKTAADVRPELELPADVINDVAKLKELVRQTYARIEELQTQLADPSLKSDPARKRQLQAEYEQLHYRADAAARRWAQLEPQPSTSSRP